MPSVMKNLSYSWLPKGTGEKGPGLFSNSNSHDAEPTYLAAMANLTVRSGAWVSTLGNTVYGTSSDVTKSMEFFNFYTGVNQTLTSYLLAHQPHGGVLKNVTTGANIRTGMSTSGRVVFASVKNRMFMSDGVDTPFISANGGTYYPWGVNSPAGNMTYNIGASFIGNGFLSGTTFTWTGLSKFPAFSPSITPTIIIGGVTGTVTAWNSSTNITVSGAFPAGYQAWSMGQTIFQGVTAVTQTSANVGARVSGDSFLNLAPNKTIYFENLYDTTHTYVVGSVTDLNNLVLTAVYSPASDANAHFQGNTGPMDWSAYPNGYQYSYYYWDQITGHASTESPVLNVSDGAPFNKNVSVNIMQINTTADTRFTKVVLCRTAVAGSDRYPIAVLPNSGGPLSYMDTLVDDTRLGTDTYVGTPQPGKLRAPTLNNPPPSDLNFATYWNGRFWGASNTQVGILFYSARNYSVTSPFNEIDLGVGEESWPLGNTLNIPGSDGRITGLRVVADSLFVLTDLSIYQVVGSTPNQYYLYKATARGGGTSHFATCEIPGTDTNAGGDILAYVGNDGRVHFLFSGGGDYPQSYPIQDLLDDAFNQAGSVQKSFAANLGIMHRSDATYLVLQIFSTVPTDLIAFLFDLDRKIWFPLLATNYGCACFVEGLLNNVLTAFTGTFTAGNVYKFLDPASVTKPSGCTLQSHLISPPGLERKQDKDFQGLVVYTNEPLALATVQVFADSAGVATTLTRTDTADARIAALFGSDDSPSMYVHIYVPQGVLVRGRVFSWLVSWAPTIVGSKIQEVRWLISYEDATQSAGNV